jgi:hypothetical protein
VIDPEDVEHPPALNMFDMKPCGAATAMTDETTSP